MSTRINFFLALSLFVSTLLLNSCKPPTAEYETKKGEITWLTISQADELDNIEQKLYFIDLYTDWCGWCKVMDKKTFADKEVADQMNLLFHNIKFDAEQKEDLVFNGKDHQWMPGGRNGINTLTLDLLGENLSYPSYAILDANKNLMTVLTGYIEKEDFLLALNQFKK